MIFGEDRNSDYFVVTNLQDKKIDNLKIFNKEDWSSAYQNVEKELTKDCLLYTSPSPRDGLLSRMPSSA